jgi:hypothetical protein
LLPGWGRVHSPADKGDDGPVAACSRAGVEYTFDNFTATERKEIIAFFRTTFAKEIQDNWLNFIESDPAGLFGRGKSSDRFPAIFRFRAFPGTGKRKLVYETSAD